MKSQPSLSEYHHRLVDIVHQHGTETTKCRLNAAIEGVLTDDYLYLGNDATHKALTAELQTNGLPRFPVPA